MYIIYQEPPLKDKSQLTSWQNFPPLPEEGAVDLPTIEESLVNDSR